MRNSTEKVYATKKFRKDLDNGDVIIATAEIHSLSGQEPYFSITGELYDRPQYMRGEPSQQGSKGTRWLGSCGQLTEEIAVHIPELAPYLKYHLVSTAQPMHYVANAVYHASDKDYNGLRKGETRQRKNNQGLPMWERKAVKFEVIASAECPSEAVTVEWQPCMQVGEGKERDLAAARSCAVWPEATDEELMSENLKEVLIARLPRLMEEFRAAMVTLFDGQVEFETLSSAA